MRAVVWMLASRAALRVLPHKAVRRLVPRVPARRPRRGAMSAADCELALRRGAAVLPGTSCLARAVAAACLLRRDGHGTVLTIGVGFADAAASRRGFQAHAWLESDGVVVVGGAGRAAYTPLLSDTIPAPGYRCEVSKDPPLEEAAIAKEPH